MSSKKLPFTPSERELIGALVRERPIIEDKRTNALNIELKKKAWEELTTVYNAQPYVTPRKNIQIKRCWENIKTLRKKELSQESCGMRRTELKKLSNETEAIVKRAACNMRQDTELHELKVKREKLLIKREENLIDYESQLHSLQLEKIKSEIELLKKQLQN